MFYAFLSGAAYVVTGFLKDPTQDWSWEKALKSIFLAVAVGFIVVAYNLNPEQALSFATTSGFITVLIDNLAKAIIRRFYHVERNNV